MAKAIAPALQFAHHIGFAAKGFVYLLVGFLAAKAVLTRGGAVQDEQGALHQVLAAPFGKVLLAIAAAGLFVYVFWRLVELFRDPEEKGAFSRSQALLSALVYASLGVEAVRMILGLRTGGGGDSEAREQAAFLIALPFGHWLTIVVGIIAVGLGLTEIYHALARHFEDREMIKGLDRSVKPWVFRLGRFGILARGLVSTAVGGYLLLAGIHRSPSEAKGTRGAIQSLGQNPFGTWILALIALGLTAYGIYTLVEARYRKLAVG
jgi:hypothetical protein